MAVGLRQVEIPLFLLESYILCATACGELISPAMSRVTKYSADVIAAGEYLLPGFDPNRLTLPHLRSILLEHAIPYPSNATKPQLVQIFVENIPRMRIRKVRPLAVLRLYTLNRGCRTRRRCRRRRQEKAIQPV